MVAKKSISQTISGLFVALFILSATPFHSVRAPGIRYVKPDVSANGNCFGWANACTLQTALTGAIDGDEIWAAAGTYKPTADPTDRTATFLLLNGVAVYGGFAETETARDQRNFTLNTTILSGDLNGDDNDNVAYDEPTREDNSYHVVTGATGATLDGFTIMAGNANKVDSDESGGGMLNNSNYDAANMATNGSEVSKASSTPLTLTNITFINNTAYMGGGGMYNERSDPALTNVLFTGNSAKGGGGMCNEWSNPTLTNVNFSGNTASIFGGGMLNEASDSPMVTNVTFSGNSAPYGGGMINLQGGNPILTNVDFIGNSAEFGGGGMVNDISSNPTLTNTTFTGNTATMGGGMYNEGSSPILTTVTFNENSATLGGGMYNQVSSNPTLTNTIFSENTATSGGGMYNREGSSPVLTNVSFNNNSATENGAGIYIYEYEENSAVLINVSFNNNSATKNGGGIYNENFNSLTLTSLTLTNVTFTENSAQNGGGIYNLNNNPMLTNGTFSRNSATDYGGGLYNKWGSPTLSNVTFSDNSAAWGGGICNDEESSPTLVNVTFNGNSADFTGGGMLDVGGKYGASYAGPELTNVTFSGNSAQWGGGMANTYNSFPTIRNTIFWDNTASNEGAQIDNDSSSPTLSDSVVQDGYEGGTNIITTDPKLGPLGNYGGFTQTIPLQMGSSAIDTGNDAVCPLTDQRGVRRPQGAHCDIGAFEGTIYPIYLPLILR